MNEFVSEELICPDCKGELTNFSEGFVCRRCGRRLHVVDGILYALPSNLDEFARGEAKFHKSNIRLLRNPWRALFNIGYVNEALHHEKDLIPRLRNSSKILEVGAGAGIAALITKLRVPEAIIYVTDVSESYMNVAKQLFELFRLQSGSYLIMCDGQALPLAENLFDSAYSWAVIHHINSPVRCLKEIHRVLKQNGIFFAHGEAAYSSLTIHLSKIYSLKDQESARKWGYLERTFTFNQWTRMFEEAGFSHVKISLEKDAEFAPNRFSALGRRLCRYLPDTIMKRIGCPVCVERTKR